MPELVDLTDKRWDLVKVLGFDWAQSWPPVIREVPEQNQPAMEDVQVCLIAGCKHLSHQCVSNGRTIKLVCRDGS